MVLKYDNARDQKWRQEVVASAGQYSVPIIIPGFVDDVVAIAIPGGGGTAGVYYTIDPESDVDAAPGSATWLLWDEGVVAATTGQTALGAVTALRIQAITADATLKVVGNKRAVLR